MNIEYKTDAKVVLNAGINTGSAIVKWTKGEESIHIYQGPHQIDIDKRQLLELASLAEAISKDLLPKEVQPSLVKS